MKIDLTGKTAQGARYRPRRARSAQDLPSAEYMRHATVIAF